MRRARWEWPLRSNAACARSYSFELRAGGFRLSGLQVAERQVQQKRGVARALLAELLVDGDGPRVEADAKIHDREKVLTLLVSRLPEEGLFELFFGLELPSVLEQLATSIEMEEEVLVVLFGRRIERLGKARA